MYDLFTKAYCPYRVYIGVCEQINMETESDCRTQLKQLLANEKIQTGIELSCFDHNLRVLVMPAREAKGPTVARSLIETNLYRGEMFFMCIDSHMVMAKHWDKKAIAQLRRCQQQGSKPILTMHPEDWVSRNTARLTWADPETVDHDADESWYAERPARFLCAGKLQRDSGLIELASRPIAKTPVRPLLQMFWSPCFSFTYASAHIDVPMDPECHYLFAGEEIGMSVRLWTHGWDFYVPFSCLCLHKSDRSYRRTFWELGKSSIKAEKRIQAMIGIRGHDTVKPPRLTENIRVSERYGPGTVRTIAEFEQFANVNFADCHVDKMAVLGIVNQSDPVEILCKYGSNENYLWTEHNTKDLQYGHR